jgi:hypothetical protein
MHHFASDILRNNLQGEMFIWPGRTKLPCFVDEHKRLITDVDQHVELTVSVHVLEAERNGGEVVSLTVELRPGVDHGFGTVARRTLDNLHLMVQVQGEKVARCLTVIMTHPLIDLEGARPSKLPVVLGALPPRKQQRHQHPTCKHQQQEQSHVHQPMQAKA